MKPLKAIFLLATLMATSLILTGCVSPPPPETEKAAPTETPPHPSETPTSTPDPCTGWVCTIDGVVYARNAESGNVLSGVVVSLNQSSYCSPTRGEQEAITGEDGTFSFEVFLHDTDGFNFKVELDGYQEEKTSFGGFDCLYCSCPPVEIVLEPEE